MPTTTENVFNGFLNHMEAVLGGGVAAYATRGALVGLTGGPWAMAAGIVAGASVGFAIEAWNNWEQYSVTVTVSSRNYGLEAIGGNLPPLSSLDGLTPTFIGTSGTDVLKCVNNYFVPMSLVGNGGNDKIWGAAGADTIEGGSGNDLLNGCNGNDFVLGGGAKDTISGGNGDDRLDGGGGNDVLRGGRHDDKLIGGSGRNTLQGEDGEDRLVSSGRDTLWGEQKNAGYNADFDTFVFKRGADSTIKDFNNRNPSQDFERIIFDDGSRSRDIEVVDYDVVSRGTALGHKYMFIDKVELQGKNATVLVDFAGPGTMVSNNASISEIENSMSAYWEIA